MAVKPEEVLKVERVQVERFVAAIDKAVLDERYRLTNTSVTTNASINYPSPTVPEINTLIDIYKEAGWTRVEITANDSQRDGAWLDVYMEKTVRELT